MQIAVVWGVIIHCCVGQRRTDDWAWVLPRCLPKNETSLNLLKLDFVALKKQTLLHYFPVMSALNHSVFVKSAT